MRRYPDLRVRLRTGNALALVAAVRYELRRAGVERDEIRRFTTEALAEPGAGRVRAVCSRWVATEVDDPGKL